MKTQTGISYIPSARRASKKFLAAINLALKQNFSGEEFVIVTHGKGNQLVLSAKFEDGNENLQYAFNSASRFVEAFTLGYFNAQP